jgi:hypothetical protein
MRLFMAVPVTITATVANIGGQEISAFRFELNGTLRALDTSPSSYGGIGVLATQFAVLQKEQISVVNTIYRQLKIYPQCR